MIKTLRQIKRIPLAHPPMVRVQPMSPRGRIVWAKSKRQIDSELVVVDLRESNEKTKCYHFVILGDGKMKFNVTRAIEEVNHMELNKEKKVLDVVYKVAKTLDYIIPLAKPIFEMLEFVISF